MTEAMYSRVHLHTKVKALFKVILFYSFLEQRRQNYTNALRERRFFLHTHGLAKLYRVPHNTITVTSTPAFKMCEEQKTFLLDQLWIQLPEWSSFRNLKFVSEILNFRLPVWEGSQVKGELQFLVYWRTNLTQVGNKQWILLPEWSSLRNLQFQVASMGREPS